MTARTPKWLVDFVIRWEMLWYLVTLLTFAAALVAVIVVFPDVSNLWVSIFVLVGSFTAAVGACITAIKGNRK